MFHNWAENYNDEFELLKKQGYLIASFDHPDAVRKILGVGAQTHASTDEEIDSVMKKIIDDNTKRREEEKETAEQKQQPSKKKRKRKISD